MMRREQREYVPIALNRCNERVIANALMYQRTVSVQDADAPTIVRCFRRTSILVMYDVGPRSTTTSFSTKYAGIDTRAHHALVINLTRSPEVGSCH